MLVIGLSMLVLGQIVVLSFRLRSEEVAHNCSDNDTHHYSDDHEPDEGRNIDVTHSSGASGEMWDLKGKGLGCEEEGEESLDHFE